MTGSYTATGELKSTRSLVALVPRSPISPLLRRREVSAIEEDAVVRIEPPINAFKGKPPGKGGGGGAPPQELPWGVDRVRVMRP